MQLPEKSLMKSRWVVAPAAPDEIARMARTHDIPEIIACLLVARGINVETAPRFLNPTLKDDFPDPAALADMTQSAEFLADAIKDNKNIALFGDFDVDGATSAAIMHRFLRHFGVNAPIYIPDRLTEGYGPNIAALSELKQNGAEIVILLDCGTTAFDIISAGRDMGLEIVILDHHEAEDTLPPANHIINPKRRDDISGLTMLAACGVTFLTCVAVNAALRQTGFYTQNKIAEPPLREWLDLVALGTVCDMVPLTGANRLFVRHGFSIMNNRKNPGINALLEVCGINDAPDTYHAGFMIGPRINAGGRIHKAGLGAELLVTDDAENAKNIAWILNDCNDKRREIQVEMEQAAIAQVESGGLDKHPVIIVDDNTWHPGLAGLVAGRLKDKYARPACVVTYTENGAGMREGRGSGRSVPGIDIARAFIDARAAGLLEKGGGHAMAGGFTILPERLDDFRAFMFDHIARQSSSNAPGTETLIDGALSVRGVNIEWVKMLARNVGPFGQGNPEPMFLFSDVVIHSADIVGQSHVRVLISDREGGPRIKAVAFRAVGTDLGNALLTDHQNGRRVFHIIGQLKINAWQGRESAELHIRDAVVV